MEITEQVNSIVAKCEEISKSMANFATTEKVEALAKQYEKFAAVQRANSVAERKHAMFGTHANYNVVANSIAKALVGSGKIEASKAGEWLTKANADVNSTDANHGDTFLPVTIDTVVSKLVEANGVLRRYARVRNGVKGTLGIKKRATRTTVNGKTRPDGADDTGGSTYDPVDLSTYEVGHITTVEEKLIWDSPVDLVQEAISDLAEAAAEFEDDVLFSGGGTAADLGFTGLNSANTGVGGLDESVAYGSFTVDNALNVRTMVHTSVFGNGTYFMHPYIFALLQTKKASTAGSYFFDITTGSFTLGGSQIQFAPRMDSAVDSMSDVPVIYGDLNKAITVGLGRNYEIRILNELYAAEGQVGVRLTYDMGVKLVQPTAVAKVLTTS